MTAWWRIASDRIAQGVPCALVTICAVEGSAPREVGARMLVWDGGQDGTVGGGKLEFTIVEQAVRLLESGQAWRFQNYPLGPLLGQCCGGRIGILIERLDANSISWLTAIAQAEASSRAYASTARLQANGIVRTVSTVDIAPQAPIRVIDSTGGEAIKTQIGEGFTIIEHSDPCPHLLMFGAGHVGRALAPIAAALPFHASWFDSRAAFVTDGAVHAPDPVAQIAAAPPGSFFLIFTHSHELDYALTRAVLARGDFRHCGLIGSATKRARFSRRLLADGIARDRLARLTSPIGAIGLKSKLPAALAVAVAAELLLVLESAAQSGAQTSVGAAHG